MKKFISLCACVLLITCSLVPAFAVNASNNTLSDQITLSEAESEGSCTIAYAVSVDQESDWNLDLYEEADGTVIQGDGDIEPGSTITVRLGCAEDTRLKIAIIAFDGDRNQIEVVSKDNGPGGGGALDVSYTVTDEETELVQVWFSVLNTQNTFYFQGFSINLGLFVGGRDAAAAGAAEADGAITDEAYTEDVITESEDADIEPEDEGSGISPVVAAGGGAAILAIIAVILKGKAGKAASVTAVKIAKTAAENAAAAADMAEETRVVTDSATGAQTLYIKDASGQWVSSDGSSVLDTDKLPDWQKQRDSDRAWQDKVNEEVEKPTKFEEIDRKQALEEEQIHRESYIEQVATRHGVDASDMDAVYEKVAHDQARAEVDVQKWTEVAEHNDTGLKIAENLKTTADYSVSALGAVTGPAGTVVKDVYAAGTTIMGDVSEAVAAGKDAFDVAQAAAGAVTKSAVSVIQNHATGVAGKSAADIVGGAASGGIDAYVKGESVGQGIAKGTASGAMNAMVDTGGEMVGALKDGSTLGADAKDFVSSVSDTAGDLAKNASSDAIEKSFDKTFEELNPGK